MRVWAPRPNTVELEIHGRRLPMAREADGWWNSEVEAAPGDDYAFVLDRSEPPLPDPRSQWQPMGVHGPSRVVDHGAFAWTDARFRAAPLPSAILYELHIGTFSPAGTFDGAIENLDHLVRLGVTHVNVMPVAEFSGSHGWGYDGVDLYAPHHCYGGPDGFKRFVDACHARDLAVILDVVYNHLGPAGNYLDRFGPYFTARYSTGWGAAVNFDQAGSDEVRAFVVDNARMWLRDYHVDGLRLDAIHAIVDMSAFHVLEELRMAVDTLQAELARPLVLIVESDLNDPRLLRPKESGGLGMDAQWSDDFHHSLHALLTGERSGYYADYGEVAHLAKALREAFVYDWRHATSRGRRHGRSAAGLSASRFLAYAQNHDQVGNRAGGERLSHLVSPALLKVSAAVVLLAPFVPMLFQGAEWGSSSPFLFFTDHRDPDLAEAIRQGRRAEFEAFGWSPDDVPDPQDPATLARSKLDWAAASEGVHAELLEWYRCLIALRRKTPALLDGLLETVHVSWDESARWLVARRGDTELAVNLGPTQVVPLADPGGSTILLASAGAQLDENGVRLDAEAVVVIRRA